MMLRTRSPLASSVPLRLLAMALGAGLAGACAYGSPSPGSTGSDLAGGSGSGGAACAVGTLAVANVNGSACGKNSRGGSAFESSCTGNGGSPEYWCADFAIWTWKASGADVGGLTAAAGSFYTYGQAHSTLSDTPSVGDAVVFNYAGGGVADHVAIVSQVNPDGTIETVSGDWNGTGSSEAAFSSSSHVVLNSPAYPGTVGTSPGIMGMKISAFISPAGISACSGGKGGTDGGTGGAGGSGSGGASGSGSGGAGGSGSGGASGSGSGGTKGSGSGGAMGSGSGGSKGSGSGGSKGSGSDAGGGEGGAYAFIEPRTPNRHHTVEPAMDTPESVTFTWHDASGLTPPADLWVEAGGRLILQVSAVGGNPFVRAGLDVAPLVADTKYRIQLVRSGDSLEVILEGPSGREVLRTRTAAGTAVADVVLPATIWRASIVSAQL
jgi:surface antigen